MDTSTQRVSFFKKIQQYFSSLYFDSISIGIALAGNEILDRGSFDSIRMKIALVKL